MQEYRIAATKLLALYQEFNISTIFGGIEM